MSDRHVDYLLIGGGIASATCAQALREEGATGSVLLVTRELHAPYHRPPISKDLLRGTISDEQALICAPDWWAENEVELLTRTSVVSLDPSTRTVTLSDRKTVSYDQALLATGAMVRRLRVPGSELEGIHYLRALGNAESLRRDVEGLERVVLVGGSYIGCEVAASLTELGKRCTIVMQEAVTFERSFGEQAGRFLQGALEAHGIEVIGDQEVVGFEPGPASEHGEGERVGGVMLGAGRKIAAPAVIAGVGAIPDVMLARRSGLALGHQGGVLCDRQLRTSAPGLFAAGDICEYDSVVHGRTMRIEHEDVAASQGHTAALNMLGRGRDHDVVPYFFSDLSDWVSLEYVGPASTWDREVVRGSVADARFTLWYLQEGRVAGMLSVGRSEDLEHARELIAGAVDVSAELERLADPGADLAYLR